MEKDQKKIDAIFIILVSLIILNAIFIIFTSIYIWTHQLSDVTEKYFESVNTLLIGSLIAQIMGGYMYNCVKKHSSAKYNVDENKNEEKIQQ